MPVQMFVKPHHYALCAYELNEQGFRAPNKAVLAAIINYEPRLVRYLNKYYTNTEAQGGGLDTGERGLLLDTLVRFYLGDDRYWPCNGDGIEVQKSFYRDLCVEVEKAGWALAE